MTILLILGLILFVGLVVVHEWGHFIAARRGGVEVEEFGIGFPPKVWAKKIKTAKSKFVFSVNALPLGGFVKLKGESDAATEPGSFGAATLSTKIKILLAGVAMNLLVALILFTGLALTGMPKLVDNQFTVASDTKIIQDVENKGSVLVESVVDGSPAAEAGLQKDDQIVEVAGQTITAPTQVGEITAQNAGQTVEIVVEREGGRVPIEANLNSENTGQGFLGVTSTSGESGIEIRRSTWSAPVVAVGISAQFTELTYKGIGTALWNLMKGNTQKASEQVAGPVGIFAILQRGSELGISFVVMITAVISLTLALINALPIPALDGGRLFFILLFKAIKRPLKKSTEEWIHGTGFFLLMLLFVLITVVDIRRFF